MSTPSLLMLTKERQYWTSAVWPLAERQKHYWKKQKKKNSSSEQNAPEFKLAKLSALWNSQVFNVNCSELAWWDWENVLILPSRPTATGSILDCPKAPANYYCTLLRKGLY